MQHSWAPGGKDWNGSQEWCWMLWLCRSHPGLATLQPGCIGHSTRPPTQAGAFFFFFFPFFFFFSLVEEEKVTQYSDSGLRINREPPYVTQGAGGAGADCHSCTAPLWPSSMRWPPGPCNPDLSAGAHL